MTARPSFMTRVLMALVRAYQLVLSPWLQTGCRYQPSCSNYGMQALVKHGAIAGTYLAAARVLRCHPFCAGGHDPVPAQAPGLFRRFATSPTSSSSTHDEPISP